MRFYRPATALLGVSMLALSMPAFAQEQAAAAEAAPSAEEANTIVVTGSRLARDPNSIAPLPISTLGADELRASGNTDATATLRQLPALLSSRSVADSLEGRGDQRGGQGQATLNLRQLGTNRTLVLVDGRRHVSGVAGTQAVDVSTIPTALIERVEVLTGGASAVYGADAVTGVVNYVLRRDFEGFQIDAQTGISSEGDGQSFTINGAYGKNFGDGRGNVTLSVGYTNDQEVLMSDRSFTADNNRANNSTTYNNPLRRFQRGDINPATMPNFASRFRVGGLGARVTRFPYGPLIPTPAQVTSLFPGGITAAEQALVDRANGAPLFAIGARPVFAISSGSTLIARDDYKQFTADINRNGVADCDESFIGSVTRPAFFGGCYVSTPGGGVKIFEDGIVANNNNQFGGDGAVERTGATSLTPGVERFYAVLKGQYAFSPAVEFFWDAKYARNNAISRNNYNTFFDSIFIAPDNPFIPAALQADANAAGGLRASRDNLDLGPGITRTNRDTYRLVTGLRGELSPTLRYDFGINYGRTDNRVRFSNYVLADRFFAAVDAVRGPNGQITCRSSVNPTAVPPGSEFFPVVPAGFYTFKAGDGSCRPANLFSGSQSISQEAVDFITTESLSSSRLEQFVATLSFSGDTSKLFELPGGAIQFAFGGEYREETSRDTQADQELGILPDGTNINTASGGDLFNLGLSDQIAVFNASGRFDVRELFGEVRVPILKDTPFFHELTVEGAARYADYSTVGGAFTWNVAGTWAPIPDVRFRGTYSQAIRAPNITELFEPRQSSTFRPSDPCEQPTIDALIAAGDPLAQNRLNNCRADGIPAGYEDPLTARFGGVAGGNPDLQEERARTWTVGAVVQPRFLPGLTLSADYYAIEIRDAIQAVSAQDIVNTCYDLPTFPNAFCGQFTRNRDAKSPTFLGFNFLEQTQINFARLETSGLDMAASYSFEIGNGHQFDLRVNANWTERLDRFFDPVRTDVANPALGELGVPEWSGTGSIFWVSPGGFGLGWRTQYIGRQAIASAVQIERVDLEFGPAGIASPMWVHDLSASFTWKEGFEIYGGINNVTNERPFIASSAYPVSGIGRFYFLGMRARF
jgi:outer membrane receptor protein involved in Fe transport